MFDTARLRKIRDEVDTLLAEKPVTGRRIVRESPYGRRMRIVKQFIAGDPQIDTHGLVLTEAEHGIEQHMGFTTMTPKFPGIRGYHYLVHLDGDTEAKPISRDMFELE